MDSLEWKVPPKEPTNFTVSDDLLPFLAGEIKMDVPKNKAASEEPTKKAKYKN
jgi:hypothetical protein